MTTTHVGQKEIVSALSKKPAYPHKVPSHKIKVYETHISWIFLTGSHAYKLKKELKFGKVLDFSSLRLRKKFCQKEVALNQALCGEMYEGVVKVVRENGNLIIANLGHRGKALEYAVRMREFPQEFRMDNLIAANKITMNTLERLARIMTKFHSSAPTNTNIKNYGSPTIIKKKIDENFETLAELNKIGYSNLYNKLVSFIANNKRLFYERIREDKVREIHGDLYLKNIFILPENKFYLYDRLEFNDSLRYADVAEDVAHLSMDLDYNKRISFRKYFVSQYIGYSRDHCLERLLYFLMCYKACVRAKVSLFGAKNETVNKRRTTQLKESKHHLELAESYSKSF